MTMKNLEIRDLCVEVEDKQILKGINLTVNEGEIHVLMGPNGNGKSTLVSTIMGDPSFTVTKGSITYDGKDVLSMPVNERSKAGIFLGMQYPQEIAGVTNSDFLRAAINVRREKPISLFEFIKTMDKTISDLKMSNDLAHRFLNENFSGGEKKRNEIAQMQMLKPSLAMLDEIDSGLDVDAIKLVSDVINRLHQENNMSLILISHYERFLEYINPQFTHVIVDGVIVESGGRELYEHIDKQGYDWIYEKYNLEPISNKNDKKRVSIGTCAVKDTLREDINVVDKG